MIQRRLPSARECVGSDDLSPIRSPALPGSFIAELRTMLSGGTVSSEVVALSDVHAYRISAESMMIFVERNPYMRVALWNELYVV